MRSRVAVLLMVSATMVTGSCGGDDTSGRVCGGTRCPASDLCCTDCAGGLRCTSSGLPTVSLNSTSRGLLSVGYYTDNKDCPLFLGKLKPLSERI